MTISLILCPECGATVPPGRLSCRDCGALLASVSGRAVASFRRVEREDVPVAPEPALEPYDLDADLEQGDAFATVLEARADEAAAATESTTDPEPALEAAPEVVETEAPDAIEAQATDIELVATEVEAPEAIASETPEPEAAEPVDADAIEAVRVAVAAYAAAAARLEDEVPPTASPPLPVERTAIGSEPSPVLAAALEPDPALAPEPDTSQLEPDTLEPAPVAATWAAVEAVPLMLTPRPYPVSRVGATPASAAYRPPSVGLAAATIGRGDWPGVTTRGGVDAAVLGAVRPTADAAPGELDAARYDQIAGWFVIVGAALAILGFLLPWSRVVIGARGYGGYFDAWGLASPTHIGILIGLMAVLALSVLRTPIPTWLSAGLLGLVSGGLLLGLVWPYVVGPLGADIGVLIVGIGGIALVFGGGLGSWASRHLEDAPPV